MEKIINIKDKQIGIPNNTFIIAEAGVNHNGDLNLAFKLIDAACDAGADAVKFQTFKAENLVSKTAQMANYQKENLLKNTTQFEMLKELELSKKEFIALKEYADKKGIIFLSTPFDFESVDILQEINVAAYKISSSDINNIPFIKHISRLKKPIILSTGMSTLAEVDKSVQEILKTNSDLALLHCTTNYPVKFEDVNMNVLRTYKSIYDFPIGFSDHTQGFEIAVMSVSLGANIVEKHFTLNKNMAGPDHKASLEPKELKEMVNAIRNVEKAFGSRVKKNNEIELQNKLVMQKSIAAQKDICNGDILTNENICIKRPGDGISPEFWDIIIGKKVNCDIKADEKITWESLMC